MSHTPEELADLLCAELAAMLLDGRIMALLERDSVQYRLRRASGGTWMLDVCPLPYGWAHGTYYEQLARRSNRLNPDAVRDTLLQALRRHVPEALRDIELRALREQVYELSQRKRTNAADIDLAAQAAGVSTDYMALDRAACAFWTDYLNPLPDNTP